MAQLETPADALPLLAYKIAPRQFDLSYRFSNISLRDQIVRGQTLVRTLKATDLIPASQGSGQTPKFDLLICGAGAAGLAAAKEAAELGMSFVLVERDGEVPGGVLSKDADRYVSTAMYEWPHPNHTEHAYPLSHPALLGGEATSSSAFKLDLSEPVLVAEFGRKIASVLKDDIKMWSDNFDNLGKHKKPARNLLIRNTTLSESSKRDLKKMLDEKVSIHGIPLSGTSLPNITLDYRGPGDAKHFTFRFEYVVYAVGFAKEAVVYADEKKPYRNFEHSEFWAKDKVSEKHLGFGGNKPCIGILGSGDGALQDALRCMVDPVEFPHPLKIWEGMMERQPHPKYKPLKYSIHVREALARIAAADCYTTSGAVWSHETHVFQSLDKAFNGIIDDLLKKERFKLTQVIGSMLRDDVKKVTIVTQRGHFSKSYALNRFLVLLFLKVLPLVRKKRGATVDTVELELLSGVVTKFRRFGGHNRGAHIEIDRTKDRKCDLIIIRGGLDKKNSPSQLIGLTHQDTGRAELGRIPAPIRPVSIPNQHTATSTVPTGSPAPSRKVAVVS